MAAGKAAGHLNRLKYNFLSECAGLARRRLKDALKAAVTFPPDRREPSVPVDHHAAILASMEHGEVAQLEAEIAAGRIADTQQARAALATAQSARRTYADQQGEGLLDRRRREDSLPVSLEVVRQSSPGMVQAAKAATLSDLGRSRM